MAAKYNEGQNHISSIKINYLHYVLKQLNGFIIHPEIDKTHQHFRIADLGTQTAAWPIDAATILPDGVEVDGFDQSSKFFPPASWLPSNVKLYLQDVYNPFPEQFIGKYDMVHIRMFLMLSRTQIERLVRNAIALLRPGGFIQWTEHDKTVARPTAVSSDLSTKATEAFIAMQQKPFPNYNYRWVNDIAPTMEACGLQIIAQDRISVKPHLLNQMNELHLLSLMDVPTGLSEAVDRFRDTYSKELVTEHESGVSIMDGFICVVARHSKAVPV